MNLFFADAELDDSVDAEYSFGHGAIEIIRYVLRAARKGAAFAARNTTPFGWHRKRNREEEPVLTS